MHTCGHNGIPRVQLATQANAVTAQRLKRYRLFKDDALFYDIDTFISILANECRIGYAITHILNVIKADRFSWQCIRDLLDDKFNRISPFNRIGQGSHRTESCV
ncbi:hypothetical protein SHVI106290_01090 [Shewanella violacea]